MEKEVSSTTQDPSGAVKGRKKFYITTAIMYTNGLPHIGHVYEVIGADVLARYHRVCGSDVFFLTGTDEHGQKVAESAAKESLAPLALCDRIVEAFKGVNQAFGISNDDFIRTTEERHRATCCWLWERAVANGDIYLGNYEGWYNTREEKFVTETEAQASNYTDPTSGKPLTKTSEPSYFFRLSKYQAALLKHIHDHPNFILPAERKQEILARLEEPLIDLSISRTTFDWGIPCPQAEGVEQGKEKHVMYVWFDALTNYLSGVDYDRKGERAQYWPPDVQVVGKDIAWFHTVIWPCMLLSAQIPLPVTVFSHGFVNDKDGRKQSKSIGNIVDPLEVLKDNSADNIRYYLMRDGVYGGDLSYNAENVVTRHDTELCDSLGNLVSRVLNLCKSYSAGCIPDAEPYDPLFNVAELKAKIDEHYRAFQIHAAIEVIFEQFRHINNWLAEKAPWLLKGENVLPEQRRILRTALEATFILCHLIQPVIPDKIATVCQWFGHPLTTLPQLTDFNNLKPGTPVIVGLQLFPKKGETRFVKGQKKAAEGGNNTNNTNNNAAPNQNQHAAGKGGKGGGGKGGGGKGGGPVVPEGPLDVRRADLRVGLIRSCKPHRDPTGAHLYEEEIDVGETKPRSVVSGLAKFIPLDEMQNRLCVVVCNMKPSTFKGVLSEAMVLCANSDDHSVVQLIEPPPGSKVGERLACEGFNTHTDPFPPQFNPKKKEFEAIKPDLKTDEKGVACYKGVPLVTSVGPCTAKSLNNAALG